MPWLGIRFEPLAGEGGAHSPKQLRGLIPPIIYPYAHGFVEDETQRTGRDPEDVAGHHAPLAPVLHDHVTGSHRPSAP